MEPAKEASGRQPLEGQVHSSLLFPNSFPQLDAEIKDLPQDPCSIKMLLKRRRDLQ